MVAQGDHTDEQLEAAGATAASTRLRLLRIVVPILHLEISAAHGSLEQFANPPAIRRAVSAPTPQFCQAAHFELGAADESDDSPAGEVTRGCFALVALNMHMCVRMALALRSGGLERAANGMGVARAGVDFKKHKWKASGRPLLCSVLGVTGSDAWFERACAVLAEGGFETQHASLLRAHDGPDGDPSRATRFLPDPPTSDDWQKTLRHLCEKRIHYGGCPWQGASLGCPPSDGFPPITHHSPKFYQACVWAVARVHSSLLAEPGAWAGSKTEASTVSKMLEEIEAIEPRPSGRVGLAAGLRVAKGYAATGLLAAEAPSVTVAEVEHAVYAALRAYVQEVGVQLLPTRRSWKHLADWLRAASEASPATPTRQGVAATPLTTTPEVRVAVSPWTGAPAPAWTSEPGGGAARSAADDAAPPRQPRDVGHAAAGVQSAGRGDERVRAA